MTKLISVFKRYLPLIAAVGLITPCAIAQSKGGKPTKKLCPLPEDYAVKTTSNKQSPPAPQPYRAVLHNGKILCVPQSAHDAHMQHGDVDKGPCTQPGNEGQP